MPKSAKKNPRNAPRGTRPSMYRLGDDTLAELDLIAAHLGTTSRAAAIRYAAKRAAESLGNQAAPGAAK